MTVASVMPEGRLQVTCSRGVKIVADKAIAECAAEEWDLVVCPGGLPGADHLRDCPTLTELLKKQVGTVQCVGRDDGECSGLSFLASPSSHRNDHAAATCHRPGAASSTGRSARRRRSSCRRTGSWRGSTPPATLPTALRVRTGLALCLLACLPVSWRLRRLLDVGGG